MFIVFSLISIVGAIFLGIFLFQKYDTALLIGFIACIISAISNFKLHTYDMAIREYDQYFDLLKKRFPELKELDEKNNGFHPN